ncbi:MAG TPA: hypothetical protein VF222_04800 [Nitrososphaeraceae archaeon]
MSLILGSGLAAFTSNSASAQNYGYQDENSYNSYSDSSSSSYGDTYSKYPTEDKNHECRTGPFEGFFTSSVEFCKDGKFDDRKGHDRDRDNRTVTIDTYTVVGNTSVGFAGTNSSVISSTALCDVGDPATGGSFVTAGNSTIRASQALANETGWIATAEVFGNATIPGAPLGSVTSDVECLDNPPLRP